MGKRNIYLVRHGQYLQQDPDPKRIKTTDDMIFQSDGGLTPLGIEQSEQTAKRLKSIPVTAVYSSSLPRATQTAVVIGKEFPGITVQKSRNLWECIPCLPPEMDIKLTPAQREDFQNRVQVSDKAYKQYFRCARSPEKHEVIVCHGNLIRYFVIRVLNVEEKIWMYLGNHNCGITHIIVSDKAKGVISLNDTGHLAGELLTET
jgi:serine/threonine-protein phosphatase PGAM5